MEKKFNIVEEIVESLCVQTPIIIQNVCVLLGDHRSLCMTGIALHGFDIAAVQLELVCNTGVSKTVENYFGKIVFLNQLLQCTVDGGLFGRHSQRAGNHKIIVSVLCAQCIPCHVLLGFILDKHFSNCFGEKDGSDTAVCFGAFQNLNRGTAGTQRGKTSDDIFVFQGV